MNLSPHPISLRQLQYVVAVADRSSFRRAAEACHVSQPSLSAQIAALESALGVQVFERDRKHVLLTKAGEGLVARARTLLLAADALVDSAKALGDPLSGTVRLGVIPTVGPYLLPEVAPKLRRKFPKLSFEWVEDKTAALLERLERGELDGAVLARMPETRSLPQLALGEDAFVFAAPLNHPLSSRTKPVRLEDLEGEKVLLLDDGHCFRDQALTFCERVGVEEAGFRATSLGTLVQMAAGGAGITFLPALAVPTENRRHALTVRSIAPDAPSRTLAIVWRPHSAREETLQEVGAALKELYLDLGGRAVRETGTALKRRPGA